MCEELLSSGKMDTATIYFDKIEVKQEFTTYVSRDGLMKPSDVVYITCTLANVAYKSITNCDEAYQFLVNSSNPWNVFIKHFMNSVENSNELQPIVILRMSERASIVIVCTENDLYFV